MCIDFRFYFFTSSFVNFSIMTVRAFTERFRDYSCVPCNQRFQSGISFRRGASLLGSVVQVIGGGRPVGWASLLQRGLPGSAPADSPLAGRQSHLYMLITEVARRWLAVARCSPSVCYRRCCTLGWNSFVTSAYFFTRLPPGRACSPLWLGFGANRWSVTWLSGFEIVRPFASRSDSLIPDIQRASVCVRCSLSTPIR